MVSFPILHPGKNILAQTNGWISRNQYKWTPNYPKRLKFWPIWLAPFWPRITLYRAQEICSTSHYIFPREAPRRATHAPAWENWDFSRVKRFTKWRFFENFLEFLRIFPELFRSSQVVWLMFYDVFWCPGPRGTIPEWSLMDPGNFIFHENLKKMSPKWKSVV